MTRVAHIFKKSCPTVALCHDTKDFSGYGRPLRRKTLRIQSYPVTDESVPCRECFMLARSYLHVYKR